MRIVWAGVVAGLLATTSSNGGRIVPVTPMGTPRAAQTETALQNGTVLVAGGCTNAGCELGSPGSDTAEVFDPDSSRFSPVGRMHGSRDDHVAVLLRDGRVLLAGGWGESAAGPLGTTELYDPITRSFAPGPALGVPRGGMTAALLRDGTCSSPAASRATSRRRPTRSSSIPSRARSAPPGA